jgi:hypothetical protein
MASQLGVFAGKGIGIGRGDKRGGGGCLAVMR